MAALIAVLTAACAPSVGGGASPAASQPPTEPLDCKTVGYPCAWSEVAPETAERSRALGHEAASKVAAGTTIPNAADWLESQDGVASVTEGDGVIRFMLKGGRPVWLSVGSKGGEAAKAAKAATLQGQLASAGGPPSHRLPLPGSEEPASNALGGGALLRIVGEDREAKKATVLAPFGYNDAMEAGEIAGLLDETRGYKGNVTYLENPSPASTNVTLDTFTNLDGNDVLYINSFGGTTNANDREPAHGFIAIREVSRDFHLTDAQDVGLDIVMIEGGFEVLAATTDFFRGLYPGGFQKSMIFLDVDRLTDQSLIRAMKGGSSELYAWDGNIEAAPSRTVTTRYIEDLSVTGRSSEVVYHEMAGQLTVDGTKLVGYTPTNKAGIRIRETAWLRNPDGGGPLANGAAITIIGELGDDKPDTVSWIVDIDGVFGEEPEHTSMAIYIDTLEAGSKLVSELEQIDDYTFRAEGEFDLPYDLEEGDQLPFEAIVNLPEGGPSRHSLTVKVTDEPRPDIGTVWKGEATSTANTLWPGVTLTRTATVEFTRDKDEKPDAKKVTFNVTAGSMTWTMAGDSGQCSYMGQTTVPLSQGDRGGLTFDLTQPGTVTYFGDAGVASGPQIHVAVDCNGKDRSYATRADGRVWLAPRDMVWVMDGPTISGSYRMDAHITGTYTWKFTKVK